MENSTLNGPNYWEHVNYDATEGQDDEDVANVNGDREINCYVGVYSDNGTFAQKVVTEYERLNAS